MIDYIFKGISVLALLLAVLGLGSMPMPSFGARADLTTATNPWTFTSTGTEGGVSIASSTITTGQFLGLLTLHAGVLNSYPNSTSTTATTQTLAAADITNYSTVIMTPNTGATTFTLPASSTLSAFIPTAGDMARQCWFNATTTTNANGLITFAAGTGIDLEIASSTAGISTGSTPNLTLAGQNSGCFTFIRKPATASAFDIVAQYTAFIDGD